MTCKHNWHFISADKDTLKCQRCGIETGPKPYEQRVQDLTHESVVYRTAGVELDGGFYSVEELQQIFKAIDHMNTKLEERT
jgi:hypothetical protein